MTRNYQESIAVHYLRGLASLGVVLFHVRVDLWVGWVALQGRSSATGWERAAAWFSIPTPFLGSGVMLFFVLSGFCIALPYAGMAGRPFDFKQYITRRLLRIYPPYLAAILLCLVVEATLAGLGLAPISTAETYVASGAMVQNYTTGQLATNPSLWSLPVEVELYMAFPLVYVFLRRYGAGVMWGTTGVVSVAALAGYYAGVKWLAVDFAKYWVLWSAGVVLAEWYVRDSFCGPSRLVLAAGIGTLVVAVLAQLYGVDSAMLHFFYGSFYFVALWWALAYERWWRNLPHWLANWLRLLGTVSYSLYLTHFTFFRLCGAIWQHEFGGKPVIFFIPIAFVLFAVNASWMFYRLIEAPSHIWAKQVAARMAMKALPGGPEIS